MNELHRLLSAVAANNEDRNSRLVLSTWLDEHFPATSAKSELPKGFNAYWRRSGLAQKYKELGCPNKGKWSNQAIRFAMMNYSPGIAHRWHDHGGSSVIAGVPVVIGEPYVDEESVHFIASSLQSIFMCPVSLSHVAAHHKASKRLAIWFTYAGLIPTATSNGYGQDATYVCQCAWNTLVKLPPDIKQQSRFGKALVVAPLGYRSTQETRYNAALHELGHAVVAQSLGGYVHSLEIWRYGGHCRVFNLSTAREWGIATLGGIASEYHLNGCCASDTSNDLARAARFAVALNPNSPHDVFCEMYAVARELVNANWEVIRELASVLVKNGRLCGDCVAARLALRASSASLTVSNCEVIQNYKLPHELERAFDQEIPNALTYRTNLLAECNNNLTAYHQKAIPRPVEIQWANGKVAKLI